MGIAKRLGSLVHDKKITPKRADNLLEALFWPWVHPGMTPDGQMLFFSQAADVKQDDGPEEESFGDSEVQHLHSIQGEC